MSELPIALSSGNLRDHSAVVAPKSSQASTTSESGQRLHEEVDKNKGLGDAWHWIVDGQAPKAKYNVTKSGSDFMFVNIHKSAPSAIQLERTAQQRIRSHVMRNYFTKQEQLAVRSNNAKWADVEEAPSSDAVSKANGKRGFPKDPSYNSVLRITRIERGLRSEIYNTKIEGRSKGRMAVNLKTHDNYNNCKSEGIGCSSPLETALDVNQGIWDPCKNTNPP